MALQIRRGPNAQRATTLLQTGEVVWTTDTKKLYVGDGVTTGGVNILANIAGTGFVWNPSTEQLDLAGSTITGINADNVAETNGIVPRLWYRSSLGKTHASEIFTTVAGAAHTGITFSWDDVNKKLSATVLTENAIDAVGAALVAGVNTGISFTYGPTQDAALSGVGRIDAAVDPEFIQDTVNDLFTAGVHTGITFSYSDSLNALSAAVTFPAPGGNLGSNLVMNSKDITGTGNISITGNISATGLGDNLSLNSYNINGTGNINITGSVTASGTLAGNLNISTYSIKGASSTVVMSSDSNFLTVGNASLPEVRLLASATTLQSQTNQIEMNFHASRGAIPGIAYVANTDIAYMNYRAYDTGTTTFKQVGTTTVSVDALINGSNNLPGRMVFSVAGQNTGTVQYIGLNSYGAFGGCLGLTLTPMNAAAITTFLGGDTVFPAGSAAGAIIYNSDAGCVQIHINGNFRNVVHYVGAAPATSKGASGDRKGMVFATGSYIYTCYADYTNGTPDIWARTATTGSTF